MAFGDGQPCGPALVWQDRRTASICRQWREQPGAESWQQRTGLVLDPYFSASKVQWLLENNAEAAAAKAAEPCALAPWTVGCCGS